MLVYATVHDAVTKLQDEKDDPFLQNSFPSATSENNNFGRRQKRATKPIGPKPYPPLNDISRKYSMWVWPVIFLTVTKSGAFLCSPSILFDFFESIFY